MTNELTLLTKENFGGAELDSYRNEGLKLVKTEKFAGLDVDFYKDENNNIYMTRNQIGTALEYSNPRLAINKIHMRNQERLDKFSKQVYLLDRNGKEKLTTIYNIEGIKVIVVSANRPQVLKSRLLKLLGVSLEKTHTIGYKESETIHLLHTSLNSFSPIKEYKVGKYRVDLCFPEYKLAIECDENNHKHYSQTEEKERQLFIENEGFEFYRYNPDEKGFYMGDTINDILTILLNKRIKL